mmetsp:Transcript_34685/g.62966  ORF Transcript_34685/g.62966 Transcript_34685/m.62966 type:complete len:380 (-) Transcript_34685:186-1325(-)|eukprot:CAMPEP_0197652092 /NCGR_PEP_ID=MMETSP1338-20131121/34239_1 /TAXON_ID=43686 ORGANISM="Pelagodinium beii, Strain RCC1491" /NCGR_SAMPLE_ID=MMETSP1338 /ASSEMBLY_ACC=CAM_ASM_000754 /LENGTH=379 /DNA_ID=CAMNT_0043226891 /DNA_START=143 /DNA_END=1282 /DNA_ORIENTATION=-
MPSFHWALPVTLCFLSVAGHRPQPLKKAPVLLQTKTAVVRPAERSKQAKSEADVTGPPFFFQEDAVVAVEKAEETPPVQELTSSIEVLFSPPASFPARPQDPGQEFGLASRLEPIITTLYGMRWHGVWIMAVLALLALQPWKQRQKSASGGPLLQEVSRLRITRGQDLQSMFKTLKAEGLPALKPGILTRVEGKVLVGEGTLEAPFSGRDSVFYSASVSHQRHDSIHQPPLAFHSAGKDFVLELLDAPGVRLHVSSSDVALFDMAGGGLEEWSEAFSQAPKSWCSFVLEHLVPSADASMHFKKCIDLGSDGLSLDFRECALQAGRTVTSVGEVLRDERGNLRLRPWKPTTQLLGRSTASAESLVGSVMISDNLALQGKN